MRTELGINQTSLAKRLGMSQPGVGYAARRGEKIAIEPTHKLIEQAIMFPYIVLSQKELYYILCVILLKNEFMRRLYKERLQIARMTYFFIDGSKFHHMLHVEANK
jgi:predicted transcriptional regulator